MSFEVGDKVVCVDDRAVEWLGAVIPSRLTKGSVYTVLDVLPVGSQDMVYADCISVGLPNFEGRDSHRVSRFRKLRDISQSLSELRALTVNTPALVEAS